MVPNDIVSSLIAVQMGGTGGKAKAKTITKNGVYAITDEEKSEGYVGYSPLNVNVPTGANIIPLTVTAPGIYNAADYGCDGFNPVISSGSAGGNFFYEDDDVIIYSYDAHEVFLKNNPGAKDRENYMGNFGIPTFVIFKYAQESKLNTFGNPNVIKPSEDFTVSDDIPDGEYYILSVDSWEISDIVVNKITKENAPQFIKHEVTITCKATGTAEYYPQGGGSPYSGAFEYKHTASVNTDWKYVIL